MECSLVVKGGPACILAQPRADFDRLIDRGDYARFRLVKPMQQCRQTP
jgi:hypothetical protein